MGMNTNESSLQNKLSQIFFFFSEFLSVQLRASLIVHTPKSVSAQEEKKKKKKTGVCQLIVFSSAVPASLFG